MATVEPALADEVDREILARADELVALTRELIQAPSPNPPGDERAAAAVIERYLDELPRRTIAVDERRPNVVARVGDGGRRLLLGAHLDTVPAYGGWTRDPFGGELDGARIYGRGTSDNKGSAAAMAVATKVLAPVLARLDGAGTLLFVANGDEETGGDLGMTAVARELPALDAAVIAEASGVQEPFDKLWVAARGATRFTIRTRGTTAHSSLADQPGVRNALTAGVRAAERLISTLPVLSEEHPHYGPRGILIPVKGAGGDGWGVVPTEAAFSFDLRVTPGVTFEELREQILTVAGGAPGAAEAELEVAFADQGLAWVAPSEVAHDDPVVTAAAEAWRAVLDREPSLACFPGGTDAKSLAELGVPTIPGIGPGALVRAHRPDEYVTIDELVTAARIYARLALEYLVGSP